MSGRTAATILGFAAIGISFLVPGGTFLAMALFYTGTTALSYGLAPRPPRGTSVDQPFLASTVSTVASVPVIYGKARIGLILADKETDPTNPTNAALFVVGALCHGSRDGGDIAGVDEIYLNEDLAFDAAGVLQDKWKDGYVVFVTLDKTKLGSTTQVVQSMLNSKIPLAWPTSSRGRGIAYLLVGFGYSPDRFPGGDPNITAVVRGNRVYDPRGTPSWGWSENPALCILDFLLSPIYGYGEDIANVDLDSFEVAANYCEETVEWSTGKWTTRFTCNGILDTGKEPYENMQSLLDCCRGMLVYQGDVWRLVIRSATTVTGFKLTRDNIIGDWNFLVPGVVEAPNMMTATYVDPSTRDQPKEVQWPEEGAANAYLTDDNGFESRAEVRLGVVNNAYQAKMLMQTSLKERRWGIPFQVLVKESVLTQTVGDLVEITHDTPGWVDKKAWILMMELMTDGTIRVSGFTYDANCYSYDYQSEQPSEIATNLPDPFVCEPPTGLQLSTDTKDAHIHVMWTPSDDGFLDHYEVYAFRNTTGPKCYGTPPDDLNEAVVGPVGDNELWYVDVRAVNKFGKKSAWLSGSHTTHIVKLASFSVSVVATDTEIEYEITFGEDCQYVEFYTIENAAAGGDNPLETSTYLAGFVNRNDGEVIKFSIGTESGKYRRTLMVAYDKSWLRGNTSGLVETLASSSGSGPTGAPTWDSPAVTGVTQTTCILHWVNADANSSTRVWKDGNVIFTVDPGVTHYDVAGLEYDHTYVFNLDHIYQGVVSVLAGIQEVATDGLAAAPTGFTLHTGTSPNPYELPYGRKTYGVYAMQWDTPLGAWEIYRSNGSSVPGSGSKFAEGAADPTFPIEDYGILGYHTDTYYWLRGISPLTEWAGFTENPVDYFAPA